MKYAKIALPWILVVLLIFGINMLSMRGKMPDAYYGNKLLRSKFTALSQGKEPA